MVSCWNYKLSESLLTFFGRRTSSSPSEQALILAHNEFVFSQDCFGVPDCSSSNQVVIFDEDRIKTRCHAFHLCLLSALAPLLTTSALANFSRANAQALRQLWAVIDWSITQVTPKLAQIKQLTEQRVIVLHEWQGRWRPSSRRAHATCLVAEIATDSQDVDALVYERLRSALASGRLRSTEVDVLKLIEQARERCRFAVKEIARSMERWNALERKHALLSRIFHYLNNVSDWVLLALGRYGDTDGPRTKEAELTLEELELVVWGLRIGSFSQSTLAAPLREMEEGLERLRRVETAAVCSKSKLDQ